MAKTYWRSVTDEDYLCSRIIKAKYYPKSNLWKAKFRKDNSWIWKKFDEGINFINEKVGWILGNGKNVSVWKYNWFPFKQGLRKPFSSMANPNLTVKDLWNGERKWSETIIKSLLTTKMMLKIFEKYTSLFKMVRNEGFASFKAWPTYYQTSL